jgi:hypothetical protein
MHHLLLAKTLVYDHPTRCEKVPLQDKLNASSDSGINAGETISHLEEIS